MMCKPRAIGKSNKKGKYLYPQMLKNVKKGTMVELGSSRMDGIA
jgi:hypothetical protein